MNSRFIVIDGKTYNSVDSLREFFAKKGIDSNPPDRPTDPSPPVSAPRAPSIPAPRGAGSGDDLTPGNHVRHPKYGVGLILRREGSGGDAKLTVSFPGYGQKKFVAKYVDLKKI